ncbi:MAG: aminoacetone oxidase family FAD-binding enzyme, partial [Thermodesulfobacteriota bacterium]
NVEFLFKTKIDNIFRKKDFFQLNSGSEKLLCKSLVIATGGPSLPETGATTFGYKVADDFDINTIPYQPALVPLTLHPDDKKIFSELSGLTIEAVITSGKKSFKDSLLFTHKGLSGPGILKISLWFKPGDTIDLNLLPDTDIDEIVLNEKNSGNRKKIKNLISEYLPKSLVESVIDKNLQNRVIPEITKKETENLKSRLQHLKINPGGTEGLKTAEAVKGGVDCREISSKTMESLKIKGLYFTGEVLDVTGMLGGYNLQWAWSSGWCAGQVV